MLKVASLPYQGIAGRSNVEGWYRSDQFNEKVLRTESVAASIVPILFSSVLSPRYSVLMSVFPSKFDIQYSIFAFKLQPSSFA